LDELVEWSLDWLMLFNTKKYRVMHIGKKNSRNAYIMNSHKLEQVNSEKDLGVFISDDMKTAKQ